MKHYLMTIDGASVDSSEKFDVINPATEKAFATCALGNDESVNQAVAAARAAFPAWSALPDSDRQNLMHALGGVLEENMQELVELVSLETGKPVKGMNDIGATMELMGSIGWTHVTADLTLEEEVVKDDDSGKVVLLRKPLGVVASITPWNWPLLIAIWHIIAAMRTGNTVVIKPSENTPVATARFVELANTVLPKGVLNLVMGYGEVGAALTAHDDVNKIVFTGSTPTGKKIMSSASGNLKRLVLELGGNDAAIVLPDANPAELAPQIFGAAFHNNGQTCACLKRLYVHESIHDELCAELVKLAEGVELGEGQNESTDLGPLQNREQLKIVEDLAALAREQGGEFLTGGERLDRAGYFYKPTIVAGLSNGNSLVDLEQFGPILPVIKYSNVDEAVALANDNPNGLGGSVWSPDTKAAADIAARLECGTAWINSHGAVQPDVPFGGIKQSGVGVEFGRHGLEECTSLQALIVNK